MELTWHAADGEAVLTRLGGLGFAILLEERAAIAEGVVIRVLYRDDALDGRLEVDPAPDQAAVPPPVATHHLRLVGLGWATVDLERAAGEFGGNRFRPADDDDALGARAWIGTWWGDAPPPTLSAPLVLLEPKTEGRLAARLARHGEGPAAIYLTTGKDESVARRLRSMGVEVEAPVGGPFGRASRVAAPASAPQLILVDSAPRWPAASRGPVA